LKLKISILFFLLVTLNPLSAQKSKTEYDLFLGDTINKIDEKGDKQGRWIYFGKDSKGLKNKLLKHNQIIEDGFYVDNLKNGLWKSYHTNTNKIKSEVLYKKGDAIGKAKIYTEKGKLKQEGILNTNRWDGKITFYNDKDESFSKDANDHNSSVLNFSGQITKNGKPLGEVELVVDNYDLPVAKAISDADGNFNLKLNLQSEYVINFIKKGFFKKLYFNYNQNTKR
jgi:hypothetical protein